MINKIKEVLIVHGESSRYVRHLGTTHHTYKILNTTLKRAKLKRASRYEIQKTYYPYFWRKK